MRESEIADTYKLQGSPILADVQQLICNTLPHLVKAGCGSLFHIWSGDNLTLQICRELGIQACGIELSPAYLRKAQAAKLEVYPYTLKEATDTFPEGEFDIVLATHIVNSPRCIDPDIRDAAFHLASQVCLFITNELTCTEECVDESLPEGWKKEVRHYGYRNLEALLVWKV